MFGLPTNQLASIGVLIVAVLWYGWQNRAALASLVGKAWPKASAPAAPDHKAGLAALDATYDYFAAIGCEEGKQGVRNLVPLVFHEHREPQA